MLCLNTSRFGRHIPDWSVENMTPDISVSQKKLNKNLLKKMQKIPNFKNIAK